MATELSENEVYINNIAKAVQSKLATKGINIANNSMHGEDLANTINTYLGTDEGIMVPIGTILPIFYLKSIPTDPEQKLNNNFYFCHGQRLHVGSYSELYEILRITFPNYYDSSSPTSFFYLPDMRECYVIGSGKSTESNHFDSSYGGAKIGNYYNDSLRSHNHSYNYDYNNTRWANMYKDGVTLVTGGTALDSDPSGNGSTTRVNSYATEYIIRVK